VYVIEEQGSSETDELSADTKLLLRNLRQLTVRSVLCVTAINRRALTGARTYGDAKKVKILNGSETSNSGKLVTGG